MVIRMNRLNIYQNIVGNSSFINGSFDQGVTYLVARHFIAKRINKSNMGSTTTCFCSAATFLF